MEAELFYATSNFPMDDDEALALEQAQAPPRIQPPPPKRPPNGHAQALNKKNNSASNRKTKPNEGTPVICAIPLANYDGSSITFEDDTEPLSSLFDGSEEILWYPFVLTNQNEHKAIFRLNNVGHYGLKKTDQGFKFPITGLGEAQTLGIRALDNFLVNNPTLDYEKIFGMSGEELLALIEVRNKALFKKFLTLKLKEEVRYWDKDGKLVKNWFEKAIKGNHKATKGQYDVLFSGGLYFTKPDPDSTNLKLGCSFTVHDIKHRGPLTKNAAGNEFFDENGFPKVTVCPF